MQGPKFKLQIASPKKKNLSPKEKIGGEFGEGG
jgi:hypothetical protein